MIPNRYEGGIKLTGIIYIHRISDNRFGGIAGRNFTMFRELCGKPTLKNVVIVTNMWGGGSSDINEARERELRDKFFKPAIDKGAQMARHNNTPQSTHSIIRTIIRSTKRHRPVPLQIQNELVIKRKDIVETTAGKAIIRELDDQIRRYQAELREVQEEMQRALRDRDDQAKLELEEETRRLRERVWEIKKDGEEMSGDYAAEKKRVEARIKAVERGAQKREQDEANHTHDPRDETNVVDRAGSEQQRKWPQDPTSTPTTIPQNNSAPHDALCTSERSVPLNVRKSLPSPSPTPSALIPTYVTSYVRAISPLATHDN